MRETGRYLKLTYYAVVAVIALVTALIIVGTSQAAEIDARTEPPPAALTNANDAAAGGCESVAATVGDDIHSTKSPFAVTVAPSLSDQPAPASDCYVVLHCIHEPREGVRSLHAASWAPTARRPEAAQIG